MSNLAEYKRFCHIRSTSPNNGTDYASMSFPFHFQLQMPIISMNKKLIKINLLSIGAVLITILAPLSAQKKKAEMQTLRA